jgi:hypothetical protein
MRQVAQSHRIACRNPDIDKDVRSKIAKVVALPLHENGTSRHYCYRSGDRTVLPLERPFWGKPLCFVVVTGFEALPAGSITRYIAGNVLARIFFGAAIRLYHA